MASAQYSLFPMPDEYKYVREMTNGFLGPTALVTQNDGKLFVLKVVEKSRLGSDNAVKIFVERLNHIKSLNLPNIVSYSKIIIQNNNIFLLRDYIESPSLSDVIDLTCEKPSTDKENSIKFVDYNRLWKLLLATYNSLHAHKIYPTFVKPNNIFFMPDKTVFITDIYTPPQDFDLMAKSPNPFDIGFLAPEFFTRSIQPDKTADTWSLGILLIYMYTGSLPWSTKNVFMMLNQITRGQLNINVDLPDSVKYVVSRFVQVEPSHRPMLDSLLTDMENYKNFSNSASLYPTGYQLKKLDSSPIVTMPPLSSSPLMITDSVSPPVKARRKLNTNIGAIAAKNREKKPVHYANMTVSRTHVNLTPPICVVRCRVADPILVSRNPR